jgi:transposase
MQTSSSCTNWANLLQTLLALQQVYGHTALKKSTVYDWFSQLKKGQETLENDRHSRRPSTFRTKETIEKV